MNMHIAMDANVTFRDVLNITVIFLYLRSAIIIIMFAYKYDIIFIFLYERTYYKYKLWAVKIYFKRDIFYHTSIIIFTFIFFFH